MDEWAVDLPGSPSIVPLARHWVGEVLQDLPHLVDDMQLIASELVTNCVRHSVAAEGDNVHLKITRDDDMLRLEVIDGGARNEPESGWTGEEAADFGRGLEIVAKTADAMGDETIGARGRLAWAELKIMSNSGSQGAWSGFDRHRREDRPDPRMHPQDSDRPQPPAEVEAEADEADEDE